MSTEAESGSQVVKSHQPPPLPKNDPDRIRGRTLRRSLFFNWLSYFPGSFVMNATGGVACVELARGLGAGDLLFSLIVAAGTAAIIGQLPGAMAVEWLRNRKGIYVPTAFVHRLAAVAIGVLPWVTPRSVAWPAMLMAMMVFFAGGLWNFGIQAWINWVADLVPERLRGRYTGCCNRLSISVAATTGLTIGVLFDLSHRPWFENFMSPVTHATGLPPLIFLASMSYIIGGLVGMLDPILCSKMAEPPMTTARIESITDGLAKPLRDREFLRFAAYWSSWNFSVGFMNWLWFLVILDFFEQDKNGSTAWWTEHPYVAAIVFLPLCYNIGQFLGYPIWGRAIDRFGRKPVLFVSSICSSVFLITWLFLSPAVVPFLVLNQVCGGLLGSGQETASFNMMLHFNRRGGPAYQAVGAILFAASATIGAVLGGLVVNRFDALHWHYTIWAGTQFQHTFNRYSVVIAAGITMKYLGDFILLPFVQDQREVPASDTFRFVVGSLYKNINTVLLMPLRTGAELTRVLLRR